MTDRELRLRVRIDALLDEREQLRSRVHRLELEVRRRAKREYTQRKLVASLRVRLVAATSAARNANAKLRSAERARESAAARLTAAQIENTKLRRSRTRATKAAA